MWLETGWKARLSVVLSAFSLGAILFLVGCTETATHEGQTEYVATPQTAHATFDPSASPGGSGPSHAFSGSKIGKASYDGQGTSSQEHAYGELDAHQPASNEGTYGAAIYLPPGTVAGEHPAQQGSVDLMRWDDGTGWGGIRINSDHRAHLVKSDGGGSDVEGGREFALEEGCWNWIVVHQHLKASDDPPSDTSFMNEVFLNGKRMLASNKANRSSPDTTRVNSVRFGIVEMGSQPSPLDVYLDDAFVSTDTTPRPASSDPNQVFCHPMPNVLFIVSDDQRADTMLGASNAIRDLVMTNTRDRFRNEGTEFSNAYVTTPLCCPSRASIFTGQYAHHHLKKTLETSELDAFAANKLKYSLQRYLHDWWGYRTALFGKFLNGWTTKYDPRNTDPATRPPETYFDEFRIYNGQYRATGSPFPRDCAGPPASTDTCVFGKDQFGNLTAKEEAQITLPYFTEQARQFINRQESNDSRPWFMYVAPYAPHEDGLEYGAVKQNPVNPGATGAWWRMTIGSSKWDRDVPSNLFTNSPAEVDRSDKPDWVSNYGTPSGSIDARTIREHVDPLTGDRWPGLREQQVRVLADVDLLVDGIFDELDAKGETADTLAVYISDNGYMWREHSPTAPPATTGECYSDIWTPPPPTSEVPDQPYAEGCGLSAKNKPYREAIHVPLYVRWPHHPESWSFLGPNHPQPDQRLAANVDLAPTVLDALGGLRLPPSQYEDLMDGRSLATTASRNELLTEGFAPAGGANTWASVVWGSGNQYIYTDDNEPSTAGNQPFEEYYTDVVQNDNQFGSGGQIGDPGEPPRPVDLVQLAGWRDCQGTGASPFNSLVKPACP